MTRAASLWLPLVCVGCVPELYGEIPGTGTGLACGEVPVNSWSDLQTEPPADLAGEGFRKGEVVPDFCLTDQSGDQVGMWPFYGKVVLLDISTIWCAPCQELAKHTEATWERFAGEDFVYLTVLQQNLEGEPPTVEDLQSWRDTFGITAPIVEDGDMLLIDAIQQGQYPAVLLIGPDMRVIERVDSGDVDPAIAAALGR